MRRYPMKMHAPVKDYLWGGRRLADKYGKGQQTGERESQLPPIGESQLSPIGESWELSCHPDGLSVIANGEYAGLALAELIAAQGMAAIAGTAAPDGFPVLVKLIDARDDLSVQVHPGDEYARAREGGSGKTEVWLVLDTAPERDGGSEIIYGFSRNTGAEEFLRMAADGTLGDAVNRISVKPGDVFFIEPGTLHAIGAGMLVAEVQQSSNLTYRVYDYNRRDASGKTRELHLGKAADVLDFSARNIPAQTREWLRGPGGKISAATGAHDSGGIALRVLCECAYFKAYLLDIEKSASFRAGADSFHSLTFLRGAGNISGESFSAGDTFFVPAGNGEYSVDGSCEALFVRL